MIELIIEAVFASLWSNDGLSSRIMSQILGGFCHPAILLSLQVWLQEFAWTEADKPIKVEARSIMVPDNPHLACQPVFCFETMMKLLYWSCYVYDHKKVRRNLTSSLLILRYSGAVAYSARCIVIIDCGGLLVIPALLLDQQVRA